MCALHDQAEVLLQKYDTYQMLEVARMGEKHMDEPQRQRKSSSSMSKPRRLLTEQIESRRSIVIRLLSDYLSPSWKDKLKEAYGYMLETTICYSQSHHPQC